MDDRKGPDGADGEGEFLLEDSPGDVALTAEVDVGSVVLERVRGAIFDTALLFCATVDRRVVDEVLRLMGGRVVFVPFALRVVVVPSGFLT